MGKGGREVRERREGEDEGEKGGRKKRVGEGTRGVSEMERN